VKPSALGFNEAYGALSALSFSLGFYLSARSFRAEISTMTLKRISAIACLLAFTLPAAASVAEDVAPAEPQVAKAIQTQIYVSGDSATLYLIGPVNYGTYFDFVRVVRKHPKVKTLYLGSEGGTAIDGLLIANQVRRRGFNTHVGHYCASTCTQIFMAGSKRSADAQAQIGFHRSYLVDGKGMIVEEKVLEEGEEKAAATLSEAFGLDGDAALRLSYSRAGLTDAFIERVLAVPGSDMWHPERAQLESDGVLNSAPPTLSAPKDSVGLEQAQAQVANLPFWNAMQQDFRDVYDEAILKLWRSLNVGVAADAAYWGAREPLVAAANTQFVFAPDAILDQMAVHNGLNAALERSQGYPSCGPDTINFVAPTGEELTIVEAQEKLMITVLSSAKIAKTLTPDKAVREYQKSWREFERFGLIEEKREDDPQHICRSNYQIDESIARLEAKKRIKAYRAMLSLPPSDPKL
jgi:hypothetical protein